MSSSIKEPENFEGRTHKISSIVYYILASFSIILPILNTQIGIPLEWILLIISAIAGIIIVYSVYDKKTSVQKYAEYIKGHLEEEKLKQNTESTRIFWDASSKMSAASDSGKEWHKRMARMETYDSLINIFEQSAKDQTNTHEEQKVYRDVVKRLKDMKAALGL